MKSKLNPESNFSQTKYGLTDKQMKILEMLKEGLTYKKIAANLNRSVHTVSTHVENIYRKLKVHNVAGAAGKFVDEVVVNGRGEGK